MEVKAGRVYLGLYRAAGNIMVGLCFVVLKWVFAPFNRLMLRRVQSDVNKLN